VIPEHAVVSGDLRTLSAEQERTVRAHMRAIVGQHLDGTSATIEFSDGYPSMASGSF
jgi:glutamate carboxypeptidase